MPFVKIDCGILNSTLWFDREAREVFMTALLMAEPQDFPRPIPQLKVDALTETGWKAPAGWYGFVPASGPGIIDRAKVSQEEGRKALKRLGEPEANSRSLEFGGRRLIRIDGGYLVLNYMKYRERDYTSADRSRRYRERKLALKSRRDVNKSHRDITQAEVEVEADIEADPEKIKSVSSAPLKGRAAEPAELERVTPFLTFPTIGKHGHEWTLSEERLAEWGELYPGLDLHSEARKALAWVGSSPSHRKTADGMPRFLVNWFNRATNRRVTTTVRHERRGAKSIAEQNFAGLAEDLRHDK